MTPIALVVDDDPTMGRLLERALTPLADAHVFDQPGAALAAFDAMAVDVVVTDIRMPSFDGVELCRRMLARKPDVPIIVMTAFGSVGSAVAALRAGADDYLTKPCDISTVRRSVQRALDRRARRRTSPPSSGPGLRPLIGRSSAMTELRRLIDRVAGVDATVLIAGETGTGKELVARAIHDHGPRSSGPFVAVNCAALPAPLLEAELFGAAAGAYTDAKQQRRGMFEAADGGTLFLDEIAELPQALQPKLLRALQERAIRPVGTPEERSVDVRILSATNLDLALEVQQGRFRSDLFFRLNVVGIQVPPLRQRGEDILLLADHFLKRHRSNATQHELELSPQARQRLVDYGWPGNVRELENAVERAAIMTLGPTVDLPDLPPHIVEAYPATLGESVTPAALATLEEIERRHVLSVYEATGGNKSEAARVLGLDRKTLHRRIRRYQSERDDTEET